MSDSVFSLEPIPEYGALMELAAFKADVEDGGYTNYDGVGYYATATEMSDVEIDFDGIEPPHPTLTHVVWFNK